MIRYLAPLAFLAAVPAAAQTQAQMNAEAAADYRRADAALNRQYRATVAAVRADEDAIGNRRGQARLLAAQRAWLRYRDAECSAPGGEFVGGSAEAMARNQCLAALTRERTARLQVAQENAER